MARHIVHASTVAFVQAQKAFAVVLAGPSGCGKSTLALELMALGAQLVSDDQTVLQLENEELTASAPPALAGLIEWRGVGILPVKALPRAHVVAWLAMDRPTPSRLPDPKTQTVLGVSIPCLHMPHRAGLAVGLRQYMLGQAWRSRDRGAG